MEQCIITNQESETDYVKKLRSTIMGESFNQLKHHRMLKYEISDISLEYEIVTQPDLARHVSDEYQYMVLFYDRILRHRKIRVNKSDTTWNWSFNAPCKSLKGILVLFEEEQSYALDTTRSYNRKIEKVSVILEGKPNQLYARRMRLFEQYNEICKYFTEGKQRDTNANEVQKQLRLHDLSVREYLTNVSVNSNWVHPPGHPEGSGLTFESGPGA